MAGVLQMRMAVTGMASNGRTRPAGGNRHPDANSSFKYQAVESNILSNLFFIALHAP